MGRPRKNTPTGCPCSRRFPLDPLAYKSGCAYFDVIARLPRRWAPPARLCTSRMSMGGLIASRAEVYACRLGLPAPFVIRGRSARSHTRKPRWLTSHLGGYCKAS